jgi:predicted transcriptional regulator
VTTSNPIELAAEIVTAFVSNNSLPRGELPALIEVVNAAVRRLAQRGEVVEAVIDAPAPAVSIRKSITPGYLICLDDGKRFKSLRRHLAKLGMTPEQYREKWNLSADYPMVAPNYAAERSALAKNMGLGHLRKNPVAAVPASAGESESVAGTSEMIAPELASAATIEAVLTEPVSAGESESVAGTIEALAAEPASVTKSKRKSTVVAPGPASAAKTKRKTKSKVVATPPKSGKRKATRPREATA